MRVMKRFLLVSMMVVGFISVSQADAEIGPAGDGVPRTESYLSS
ncbi:hypothetical protein NSQ26_07680 [Bacillus sp. FSL W7-1360]